MKAIILAAGYATRLYPLTLNFPKALLEVGGVTILDRLLAQLSRTGSVEQVTIVTNARFMNHFEAWKDRTACSLPIDLLNDGSTGNENRLGAVADLHFALESSGTEIDTLVSAADNIFDLDFGKFFSFFKEKNAPCICVREVKDIAARRRTGIALLDESNRVLEFAEKPAEPKSAWGVPPLYLFTPQALKLVDVFKGSENRPDAPGYFIAWLVKQTAVYAQRIAGVLDIGGPESLERAQKLMGQGVRKGDFCD